MAYGHNARQRGRRGRAVRLPPSALRCRRGRWSSAPFRSTSCRAHPARRASRLRRCPRAGTAWRHRSRRRRSASRSRCSAGFGSSPCKEVHVDRAEPHLQAGQPWRRTAVRSPRPAESAERASWGCTLHRGAAEVSGACLNWMAISVSCRVIALPERKSNGTPAQRRVIDQQAKRDVSLCL